MHPQFRQMPPRCSRSTQAVFRPSCAARIAVTYPPGPPPTTMMSKLVSAIGEILGVFAHWRGIAAFPERCSVRLLAHAGLVGALGEDRLGAVLRLLLPGHRVEIARRHVAELLEHVVRETLARSLQLLLQACV